MGYLVPAGTARFEQEIKKSRFIGFAVRASSPEDAATALASVRRDFPDATHYCWAYLLGNPQTSSRMRMDDAGEPAGTAGKPILNVLQHKGVGDVLVVVVRYFGGIKLGAGGLVRAYSSTASGVMEALDVVTSSPMRDGVVRFEYTDEQPVRRLIVETKVEVRSAGYGEHVELTIRIPESEWSEFAKALADRTSGRAKIVAL